MRRETMSRAVLTVAAGVLSLLLCAGCLENLKGLKFSHELHAEEAACADCHGGGERAGHDACADCHEIDRDNPSDECLICHVEGDYAVDACKPRGYADVTFDHSPHEDVECQHCHAGAATSSRSTDSNLPGMGVCTPCHDGEEAPAECETCHDRLRADVAPPDHTSVWDTMHGTVAQADRTPCAYCHQETGCEDCHKTQRPASHTPGWKNSGHGIAADFGRNDCDTCHQADDCSLCHRMKPASHYGSRFRVPLDTNQGHAALVKQRGSSRSCRVCHEPSFCSSCH